MASASQKNKFSSSSSLQAQRMGLLSPAVLKKTTENINTDLWQKHEWKY